MQPIEDLKIEHDAVQVTLRILDKICGRFEGAGKELDIRHMDQLLDFFRVFVDQCHHGKEEELLFPALETIGVSHKGGPLEVMLHEHQQGRELVRAMADAIDQFKKGDWTAANEFVQAAREYINLLNQHIYKENNVLFPLAEKHLSEKKLAELSQGFELIETKKIGIGRHDEFHKMLDDLKRTYL